MSAGALALPSSNSGIPSSGGGAIPSSGGGAIPSSGGGANSNLGGGGADSGSGGGGNLFSSSMGNLKKLQSGILGDDYDYAGKIYSPGELGMSSRGDLDTLTKDIVGMLGYIKVLIEGGGKAQKIGGPLGDKFFLPTAAKCKDVATKKEVTRSLYVNNQPDGSIPFISQGMGVTFGEFKGLVPGILSNVSQINPFQMLQAFMIGGMPDCQAITMQTINNSGTSSVGTGYVLNTDIANMNPCWFPNRRNPMTGASCRESFETLTNERTLNADMPKDWLVRLYYTSLALLGLYIFLKLLKKKIKD